MAERWLWEPEVAGSSPVAPRARSSAGQSKGFLIPRSGVRVPPGSLFFIHGWGFSSKAFPKARGIDLPFHGNSPLEYKDFFQLARDVALRVPEGSLLVGWSMGGSIALLMAYLFPERFRALVLIGTTTCFKRSWSEANIRGFFLRLKREGKEFLKEFRRLAYGMDFEDAIDLEGATRLLKDYIELDLTHIVPYIQTPAVIIQGTKDQIVPFSSALSLYNLLKRSILIPFQGGHFPHDESLIFKVFKSLREL